MPPKKIPAKGVKGKKKAEAKAVAKAQPKSKTPAKGKLPNLNQRRESCSSKEGEESKASQR